MTIEPYFTNNSNSCGHSWEVFYIQDVDKHNADGAYISSNKNSIVMDTDE